jgi:GAF domain-containing protein
MTDSDPEHLMEVTGASARSLDILARALHVKNAELQPTLEAIVATATRMLSPAVHAGLTVISHGEFAPRASTGEVPLLLDRLQQELRDGPCISAARDQTIFRIEDTGRNECWPKFSAEAARLNVCSMLCVPLWIDERSLGALSLYASQVAAFTDLHERVTTLLATFAALALAEAQRAGQLHDALSNRDVIGQAKGILMERHSLTADAAFSVLSRVSQAGNIKLADVAHDLVQTGKLPGVSGPDS